MPVTLEELRKVQHDVTEAELARARAQVKASLLMSLESTGSRCEQLARQIQVLRPHHPDRGDGGQAQRGDASTTSRAPPRACSAPRRRWRRWGRPSSVPGLPAIAEPAGRMSHVASCR